ncbi:MAG TPA: ATP-binding protein [Azonexus sp.]|jgi:two-component system sensor histidine kinase RegB|nr:ATP-binding protein [Azonexus sp.]
MPLLSCADDSTDQLPSLRRLVTVRWAALALMTGLLLLVPPALDVPLPGAPLLAIIGITALLNAIAAWRLKRADSATSVELLSQLLIDIFALSALVFFSGGATNPLVSLLLPPVAIAALTLPVRYVAAVGAIAIAAYSALMFFYVPLAMSDATRATRLHLLGMWLTFAVSALMVAWFAVRMTKLIRQRDAELATAREQALRDERIMAIGTLAAGAAHELGTPLGTMALVAGELACDPQLPDATREDVALLRQQIGVCKEIITGLTRRAGAERLENSGVQAVDVWLQGVRQRWHALRPQAESRVEVTGSLPAPTVANDPRLEQALLNLLNNAANASARAIDIHLDWTGERILIDIRDLGPGFPPDVLQQGGQASFPPHESGSGIGLMLTRSAIEQLGGRLSLLNPPEGGALARLELNPRT